MATFQMATFPGWQQNWQFSRKPSFLKCCHFGVKFHPKSGWWAVAICQPSCCRCCHPWFQVVGIVAILVSAEASGCCHPQRNLIPLDSIFQMATFRKPARKLMLPSGPGNHLCLDLVPGCHLGIFRAPNSFWIRVVLPTQIDVQSHLASIFAYVFPSFELASGCSWGLDPMKWWCIWIGHVGSIWLLSAITLPQKIDLKFLVFTSLDLAGGLPVQPFC